MGGYFVRVCQKTLSQCNSMYSTRMNAIAQNATLLASAYTWSCTDLKSFGRPGQSTLLKDIFSINGRLISQFFHRSNSISVKVSVHSAFLLQRSCMNSFDSSNTGMAAPRGSYIL